MKVALLKKLPVVLIGALLVLAPIATVQATKPYLKVFGADVMSGGWFSDGSSCNTAAGSNYQDPNYQGSPDNRVGGILAFSKEDGSGNANGGASSQYGAFSLGIIEGNSAASHGFYSAGALTAASNTAKNKLSFANDDSAAAPWGGFYEGSVRQSSCLPDYYSKLSTTTASGLGVLSSATASGAYTATATGSNPYDVTGGAVNIAAGRRITLFVNGNAYIGHNITYQLDRENNVPKLALVVKGNIYIDPSVTRIDGLYIAQPAGSIVAADDGAIWTCHRDDSYPVYTDFIPACGNPLTVNGALIAKQVNFLRTRGDISAASTNEDSLSGATASNNIAEIVNYTPAMVVGGPFFNQPAGPTLKVQSIISLPPVF
ncbi:MAG: hypothetical protein WD887_01145 [Candidatus Saccharimonadales bacterium]